jgi:hypothetical protein
MLLVARGSWGGKLIPLLVLAGLFSIYPRFSAESVSPSPSSSFCQPGGQYRQYGSGSDFCSSVRWSAVHCSQMTSCEEATWFLQNCPDTKMDGEGDGIPCENQWCSY